MSLTFYKIIYPNDHFYIGSTTSNNIKSYLKGKHEHCVENNLDLNLSQFSYDDLKIEIKTNFSSEKDLRNFEFQEIKKYIRKDPLCLNKHLIANCQQKMAEDNSCPECDGKNGSHKRSCSKAVVCSECGGVGGKHFKECSQYNSPESCPECGSIYSHKKTCSKYNSAKPCPECGRIRGHKKSCSKYKELEKCPECGSPGNYHKKTCSKYRERVRCPECGGVNNIHKKTCSKAKKCPECGQVNHHSKKCSKHKSLKECPECGTKGAHKQWCSKHKKPKQCPECGFTYGHHKKDCSFYKERKIPDPCPECGKLYGHKKFCSKCNRKLK